MTHRILQWLISLSGWVCPQCFILNAGFRKTCRRRRCNQSKPQGTIGSLPTVVKEGLFPMNTDQLHDAVNAAYKAVYAAEKNA